MAFFVLLILNNNKMLSLLSLIATLVSLMSNYGGTKITKNGELTIVSTITQNSGQPKSVTVHGRINPIIIGSTGF
jgi:hypothetical protein